jgi:large subunit ribosomal protein L22
MEATAHLRHIRMAPRKISVVASLVRGMNVGAAINTLKWTRRSAALPVRKLIESALANATDRSKGAVDVDKLVVKAIWVDQATMARRYMPRAMGRATRVNKKSSHVHVIVTDEAPTKAKK